MSLTTHTKKRPVHHKKLHGAHHRHSKHYLRTYSPYLPLLLLVIVGLAVNVFWSSRLTVLGASTNLTSQDLLDDTNSARLKNNQDALSLNRKLSTAAQAKANDMARKDYWAHESPTGDTPWNFISKSGYHYYSAGENLAYGFPNAEFTVAGWMNSREHRNNLLNPDFQEVGFGIASADAFHGKGATTIIVAMYAEPSYDTSDAAVLAATTENTTAAPLRNVSRIQLLTHGDAPWSLFAITTVSLLAAAWFIKRHAKIWHAVIVESEEFVVRHKFLDVIIVGTMVAGFVLSRAAGFIH